MKIYEESDFYSTIMILGFWSPKDQLNDKDYEGFERSGPENEISWFSWFFTTILILDKNLRFPEKTTIITGYGSRKPPVSNSDMSRIEIEIIRDKKVEKA